MTPQQYERLTELFHAALEIAPDERAAFLDRVSDGDVDLRAELESLLAAHEQRAAYTEKPPDDIAAGMYLAQQQISSAGAASLAPNTRIDRYEIRSLLGKGGMGEVYLAEDTTLRRLVALKLLPVAAAANEDRMRRFVQEARAAAALSHPHIAQIFEVGKHEGTHFIAMEFVDGVTLRAKIHTERTELQKLLKYLQQVAEGLAKAHSAGIVHRDLKPDNIMITRDDYAKILDFGLAKLVEGDRSPGLGGQSSSEVGTRIMAQQSMAGMVMGTAGYMSPEQAQGKVKEIDQRSDIFSFGCILFEAVTGRKPFEGQDLLDSLHKIVHAPTPQIKETNANAPTELQRIVRRCLAKDPEERYQTIKDVALELKEVREGMTGPAEIDTTVPPSGSTETLGRQTTEPSATPTSSAEYLVNQIKTHKRSAAITLAVLVLAAAGLAFGVGAFILGKRSDATLSPSYQRLTFSRGTIWNARFAPDGQTIVYSARWNGNPLEVFSARAGKTDSRALKLENTRVLAISASNEMAVLRNGQYGGSWFISRGTLARIPVEGGAARDILEDVQDADWSPDGTKLAVVRWVNGRNQLEYPVGKVLYETTGYISYPRISPNGDLVAFMDHQVQGDNRGWVAVVDLNKKKTILSGEWAGEEGLAWSPAGDEVWFTADRAGEADALYAVTLFGRERLVLRMPVRLILHDISRAGQVLITSFSDSTNIIGQPPGETKERDLSWLDQGRLSDLSPDGQTILFSNTGEGAGINYAVYLRRTDGSPAVRLGDGSLPRLSPDGKWALAVQFTPPQLVLLPTGAGDARPLGRGPIDQFSSANWFPDGTRVTFQGREPGHGWRYYIQNIEGGPPRAITPEGTTGGPGGIFISPDSRFVIASDAQHKASFYPVESGAPQPIPHLESEDEIIGWSSDGRSLYLARTEEMPIRVYRLAPATGRRELLKQVMPADPAGVFSPNNIFITPDGKGYVYSVRRVLSDLYLVGGLK